ncbi:ribosome recycling factor [Geobacter sulfurreducens]|uniref:Ribosome-recycling factor n=1 Tax=Geobacter sulfurreducens (strain ATCC 51573 / DSM 12127 / PCA) TaxID=243231 RepID=RRF_GEOSL|nr:ribosome recycling factor [Geobacter sulfurreducens]P61304.1 RecName: Full=Ribosome-recycling factor; Short=RRF; AltName: Full=Ribosome-releasing factor [Geobacter sulfurreducens PCA]AAR35294.1 ribosome recycling factor [Geobacter sulfurreducens PCA]ADI84756.1 ribosome recycling factor [Geobacter sulfurreducens KN400]AJY68165.1 ribosome recycling factor [Geobacter sulfurreducens]QVW33871.1 ribosome recycling factor [Geobacter sulfurreducens]UAC02658.1 ribosome recycling factor [Geobacter s
MTKDVINDMKSHMEKSVESLRREYQKVRTGRANTGLLDEIRVDFYGNPSPLNQVATLAVPEPRTITIQPWETKMIPVIEKAILNANLGFTPSNDGKLIRISLPPLTEERRKEIVKSLKKTAEDAKIAIRNIRRDAIDGLKKLEKDKKISEDDLKRAEKEVQDVTNVYVAKVDEVLAHKEKEVMEV